MLNKYAPAWAQEKSQILGLLLTLLFCSALYLGFAP
jgi:hypothetical protein